MRVYIFTQEKVQHQFAERLVSARHLPPFEKSATIVQYTSPSNERDWKQLHKMQTHLLEHLRTNYLPALPVDGKCLKIPGVSVRL